MILNLLFLSIFSTILSANYEDDVASLEDLLDQGFECRREDGQTYCTKYEKNSVEKTIRMITRDLKNIAEISEELVQKLKEDDGSLVNEIKTYYNTIKQNYTEISKFFGMDITRVVEYIEQLVTPQTTETVTYSKSKDELVEREFEHSEL